MQGAYVAANSLMSDNLRSLGATFPHTDPYRSAPFNTSFVNVANATAETINDSVLAEVVDWCIIKWLSFLDKTNFNTYKAIEWLQSIGTLCLCL